MTLHPFRPVDLVLAVVGGILLSLGTYWIQLAALPTQSEMLEETGCHVPLTVLSPRDGTKPVGSVILIHGLSANRRLMTYLGADFADHGFRSYLFDLPGHGDNTDAFTFATAQTCMNGAVASLIRSRQIDPKTTIILGHSLGGAIAIRMADAEPVAATIAISPAPLTMPRRMPANLLVFSAQLDIGAIKSEAGNLARAAGGTRTQSEDFAEARAFQLQRIPFASHTTIIFNRAVAGSAEHWAMQTISTNSPSEALSTSSISARPYYFDGGLKRPAGSAAGVLGILFIFPLALTSVSRLTVSPKSETPDEHRNSLLILLETAVGAFAGVWILAFKNPLGFLHIYTGDYLASLLSIVGVLLLLLNWKDARRSFSLHPAALAAAAVLGFALVLAVGGWANWQIDDAWMNAPRWLRFAKVLPVMGLFCFAEETVLGKNAEGKRYWLRLLLFLGLRVTIWFVCVLAYFQLASGQAMIAILLPGMAMFSVLQRLGADAIGVRTGSATAASLFSAILAAWFIAAVFPLT